MSTEVDRGRGLDREGIQTDRVRWNLSTAVLYEEIVRRREGMIAAEGPIVCRTGQHTGRSPNDKFVVREPSSEAEIAWAHKVLDAAKRSGGAALAVEGRMIDRPVILKAEHIIREATRKV